MKPYTMKREKLHTEQMEQKITHIIFFIFLTFCASCSHSTFGRLVGNDRDEHGCIGSAGYTWSYALHDCVRLWEAGTRFDSGPEQIFLVFSPDSTFAEIFTQEKPSLICKRVKKSNLWTQRKGNGQVSIKNKVICVEVSNYTYTHPE